MYVHDVRMPPEPVVPVVVRAESNGLAMTLSAWSPSTGVHERPGRRAGRRSSVELLTDADRDLIRAVTGESLWGEAEGAPLSGFAHRIAADRRAGRLARGSEVTVGYLLRTGKALEADGAVNPFSGTHLQRALVYLASRDAGHIDVAM